MKQQNIFVVGAGLAGATVARMVAEQGGQVTVFEKRHHIAGNCYDRRCPQTNVREHYYGPHIFHTDDEGVWCFIQRFAEFVPYFHRVFTTSRGQVWNLPINLQTLNQFRAASMTPEEARTWLGTLTSQSIRPAENLEQHALSLMGPELYETFFRDYTEKQWGCPASSLPPAILKRLPFRFDYTDGYFDHRYQGMPKDGYTKLVEEMLSHPNITVHTNVSITPDAARKLREKGHLFWTGTLDGWFNYDAGRLRWRTLDFIREIANSDSQGCAVMNYGDKSVPWTRITDHARLSPWEKHSNTLLIREYSREADEDDIPYYPLRLAGDEALFRYYRDRAAALSGVTFLGRLGTCSYMDMDVTVRQAMAVAQHFIDAEPGEPFPAWPEVIA